MITRSLTYTVTGSHGFDSKRLRKWTWKCWRSCGKSMLKTILKSLQAMCSRKLAKWLILMSRSWSTLYQSQSRWHRCAPWCLLCLKKRRRGSMRRWGIRFLRSTSTTGSTCWSCTWMPWPRFTSHRMMPRSRCRLMSSLLPSLASTSRSSMTKRYTLKSKWTHWKIRRNLIVSGKKTNLSC